MSISLDNKFYYEFDIVENGYSSFSLHYHKYNIKKFKEDTLYPYYDYDEELEYAVIDNLSDIGAIAEIRGSGEDVYIYVDISALLFYFSDCLVFDIWSTANTSYFDNVNIQLVNDNLFYNGVRKDLYGALYLFGVDLSFEDKKISLNGNTCKFKDADTVKLSIDSKQYEVVCSFHAIVSNNTYTTIYQLRLDGTTTYAPESLLSLHVEDTTS